MNAASRRRAPLAAAGMALAIALVGAGCSDSSDSSDSSGSGASTTTAAPASTSTTLAPRDGVPATFTGPITGGSTGVPFNSMPAGLAEKYGYTEQEYFASGSARTFTATWADGGKGTVTPSTGTAAYTTRLVVRHPKDPAKFNGTVIVEWLNVSGGLDADPVFGLGHDELLRDGFGYVAVSAQKAGIEGGGGLIDIPGFDPPFLKQVDPERYGPLVHPGDDYSYDMFAGIAEAIRRTGRDDGPKVDVFDGLVPQRLIAVGESQSADRMVTFVDAFQPTFHEFDGFLIHSRFAGGAIVNSASIDQPRTLPIRDDLGVPVLQLETETDLFKLGFFPGRQADTDHLRTWEMAGTSHADRSVLDYGVASGQRSLPTANFDLAAACGRVNEGPQRYLVRGALHALNEWVTSGTVPAASPLLEVDADKVKRDEYGNAVGGIRTPAVDAPTLSLSGEFNAAGGIFCDIFGSTTPLTPEQIAALYTGRDDYVAKVTASADRAVDDGFLLQPDRDEIVAAAATEPALG